METPDINKVPEAVSTPPVNEQETPLSNMTESASSGGPKKKNRFFRFLRRLVIFILSFILFIIIAAFCIGYFYGDKIKQYAIDQLNTYLNTPVFIDPKNMDFTVLQNFPNASVDFKEVKAMEVSDKKDKDVLFQAGKISFQFNIMDIFHENYNIKKVAVHDVDLKLKVDKNGQDNYHFLKESKDTSSSKFDLALEEIEFSKVNITYLDKQTNKDLSATIKAANLSGNFSSDKYSLSTTAKLFVEHFKSDSADYLPQKNIDLDLELAVDNKLNSYTFSKGNLKIEDLILEVTGSLVHHKKDDQIDIAINGKDMDIKSVLSLVPEKYKEQIKNYESEGDFYFKAKIAGTLSENSDPVIHADFGIKQGEIAQSGSSIKLKNVDLSGKYFNGDAAIKKASSLEISNFSCALGGGSISGNFKLNDLNDPNVTANAKASIGLNDLQQFLKFDTIETVEGNLQLNASFNGKIREAKKYIAEDFKNTETSGDMSITDLNMKLKNNPLEYKNVNGTFSFKNNDLKVDSLSGHVSNSDFAMKGYFRNILAYCFLDKEDLTVDATFHSRNLDLNEILSDKESTSKSPAYHLVFPEFVDLNLNSTIDKMIFRKFEATNIRGVMHLRDKKLIADPVSFRTMDGRVTTSAMVDGTSGDKFLITCDADLDRLNITKVFYQFENFGQDYLQDKHLKGIATASVQFASVWSPELEVNMDKIYTNCDITIERGELIKFTPFLEIAEDLKKDVILNKFIEVDEFKKKLEHIKFKTLTEQVEIKKQRISFAPTVIKSSAMNIDFKGWHKFDDSIEYNVSFLLSQVLTKGEKRRQEANAEFGVEEKEENGKVLYYKMYNTVAKPLYKKDYATKREKKREERKQERHNLKQILRDEFGWFKKDTTLTDKQDPNKKVDPKKDDNKFILKWDDDEKKGTKKEEEDF